MTLPDFAPPFPWLHATTPRTATPEALAAWLREQVGILDVVPVRLTIDGTIYPAATYRQTIPRIPTDPAYVAGERYETFEGIYVAGFLPKGYNRRGEWSGLAFTRDGDPFEWYVAGFYPWEQLEGMALDTQPFGATFLLRQWDMEHPADYYAPAPFRRLPLLLAPA